MRARLTGLFEHIWYGGSLLGPLLLPVSWLYALMLRNHRRRASLRRQPFAVPVVVIGNLTVGGTGKTPVVAWLATALRERGLRPGVVTRGYRGAATTLPLRVDANTATERAGDEAVMLAQRLQCPVVACADRVLAVKTLAADSDVDVVLSDDGLQHFALHSDCDVVVVDGTRGIGNGYLLPAGPLREHPRRLDTADVVLVNGPGWTFPGGIRFELRTTELVQLSDGVRRSLDEFAGKHVHALAAIGNPDRFYAMLRAAGCKVEARSWPDHTVIPAAAFEYSDRAPVLITQKDAVKLQPPIRAGVWSVNVDVQIAVADANVVIERVMEKIGRGAAG